MGQDFLNIQYDLFLFCRVCYENVDGARRNAAAAGPQLQLTPSMGSGSKPN